VGLIDTAAAAQRLGIKPGTIRQWASRGKIQAQAIDSQGRKLYDWNLLTDLERDGRRSPHNSCAA
jgi:DNA-binding transcriptional MerR regulator